MFFEDKKSVLSRALAGGIIGLVVFIPLGGLFNDLVNGGLITMGPHTPFRLVSYDLEALVGSAPLALAIQIALYFLMGAVVGIATLPFTDSGWELVLHSLVHFAVTAGLLILTCTLLGWAWSWQAMVVYLILLAVVYLLIWLSRWVGWYIEVMAIREKLGLPSGPSPLKWRETLPYLPFIALLCLIFPLVLTPFDAADVPVLRALLYPWLLLPVGSFFSGLSLGRREGFCPLYPLAGGLLYVPVALIAYNHTALFHSLLFALPALAGNAAGAAWRRVKRK